MTRARCSICGGRVGDRRCPALDRSVCSTCCGSHRAKIVRCPPDCSYGRLAEVRLRERRAKELKRAWRIWYRELAGAGREGIWPHVEVLAQALATLIRREGATDAEVEMALRHLGQALSPVVILSAPTPPLGRALAEDGFLRLVRSGKLDGERLRVAVEAFVTWLAAYRSTDEPVKFVRGLLGLFPPVPEEEGLIVRPRGIA